MVTLHEGKQFIINNDHIASAEEAAKLSEEAAKKETLTWQVLSKHNHSDNMEQPSCTCSTTSAVTRCFPVAGTFLLLQPKLEIGRAHV